MKKIFLIQFIFLLCVMGYALCATPAFAANATMPTFSVPDLSNYIKLSEVPCAEGQTCSFPWIKEMIIGIYNYLIGAVGILATVTMMVGGFMWLMAGGDAGRVTEGKEWVKSSVIGLVLAMSSYTILYVINPDLTKMTDISLEATTGSKAATSTAAVGTLSNDVAKKLLNTDIDTNGNSLEGTTPALINEMNRFDRECKNYDNACTIKINGAAADAAGIHNCENKDPNSYTHCNGKKVDFDDNNAALNKFIETYQPMGFRSEKRELMYQSPSGACYVREATHWDITLKNCGQRWFPQGD